MTGWKDKRKVMQRYDLTAEMYEERYAEEQKAKYRAALRQVNAANDLVLDVGCGTGLFFKEVTSEGRIVVGIDISRRLLQKAKEKSKAYANAHVLQADADHLPFKDAFFCSIFAFTILQNMPHPLDTLKELKRVVNMDGRIVVTGLKKSFPLNKFTNIIEDAGFKIVSIVDEEGLSCYVSVLSPYIG